MSSSAKHPSRGHDLPAPIQEFIAGHIASVEELEVLLLLQENEPHAWTAGEINARLRSQEASIAKWLETLVTLRLAQRTDGSYRFAPASDSLARNVQELAAAYRERRIKVIEFIFSKPNENLLNFVRAFDLRHRP